MLTLRVKISSSLGFNCVLQKLYQRIFQIIAFKRISGIFLIFFVVPVLLIILLWRATFRNRKSPKAQSYNIWRSIYFKKNSTYYFEDIIYSNKLKGFFFKKDFFQESKTPNLDIIFLQKKILYFFASVIILFKHKIKDVSEATSRGVL